MPQRPRVFAEEAIYHIYVRTARPERAFARAGEAGRFLGLVREVKPRGGFAVLAWCVMPSHYHLVLRSAEVPLSRARGGGGTTGLAASRPGHRAPAGSRGLGRDRALPRHHAGACRGTRPGPGSRQPVGRSSWAPEGRRPCVSGGGRPARWGRCRSPQSRAATVDTGQEGNVSPLPCRRSPAHRQ